jgi:hypothetical protein
MPAAAVNELTQVIPSLERRILLVLPTLQTAINIPNLGDQVTPLIIFEVAGVVLVVQVIPSGDVITALLALPTTNKFN